jgi:ribonuclease VapC
MALRITNPAVVGKVECLAKATGLSKTAVVQRALDRLLGETMAKSDGDQGAVALLKQLDRIPDRADAFDPMEWGRTQPAAMIAVDTSALVAIAFAEPEHEAFMQAIKTAGKALVRRVSVVETRMVIHGRRGQRAVILLDDLLRLPMFELVAPSPSEMDAAFVAYGNGSGRPAGLNFVDVFSYALAKVRGLPLHYEGNDLAHTDMASALGV